MRNGARKGYCQRTGVRVRSALLVREPGTNLLVDRRYSDGVYNRTKLDPRNYPARPNPNEGKPRWYAEPDNFDPADRKVGTLIGDSSGCILRFNKFQLRLR